MTKQAWSGLAAALLAFGGLIAGCAPAATDNTNDFVCSASTCTGCCKGNTCVTPPNESACGAGGDSCTACKSSESCSQGRCVPDDCLGCVDPTSLACKGGTTSDACGQDGVFCASCPGGTVCQGGKCVADMCSGCKDGTGTCLSGKSDSACGKGGGSCTSCTAPQTCQDGTCNAPSTCNATSCPTGCCDSNGMCQPGTSTTACGSGGGSCSACSGMGATCTSGMCKVPCGPNNCVGCCNSSGVCVASVDATCGINGGACQACAAGSACSGGKCVDNTCKATCGGCCSGSTCNNGNTAATCGSNGNACIACSNGQVCTAGTCQLDPNSLWDFVATSGTVPPYDKNNDNWDYFSPPDPYVELDLSYGQADQLIAYGDFINDTLTPDWTTATKKGKVAAGVKASLLLKASFLQVWDSDDSAVNPALDDDMGWCVFKITQDMFDGSLQSKTCMSSQGVTWKVYFKIVPHT